MKDDWKTKPLGDVCEFQRGLTYKKSDEVDHSKNVVLRANNIDLTSNQLDLAELKYINNKVAIPDSKKVKRESLLVCTASGSKSHLGKVAFIDDEYEYAFGGFMGMITAANGVLPKFLFYRMISEAYKDFIAALNDGTNINNLRFDDLKRFAVPHPSTGEQRRIVGILDEAFDAIAIAKANAEKNLQNARALFESHLNAVFDKRGDEWQDSPLGELCDIKHGFAFKSQYFADQGEYVLLTPGNFFESGGYRDRGDKQKYYCGEVPDGFILEKGDLLVAMTEQAAGLLGSPILVPEGNKFLHNQRLGLVKNKPGVPWTNEFFFHVFNTQRVRKEIHDSASGVKVRHTSPKKIGNVVVSFPSSQREQLEIDANLREVRNEVSRLESIHQSKLIALENLRESLLDLAFSGKL